MSRLGAIPSPRLMSGRGLEVWLDLGLRDPCCGLELRSVVGSRWMLGSAIPEDDEPCWGQLGLDARPAII